MSANTFSGTDYSGVSVLTFIDSDPSRVNIQDKYYLPGAVEAYFVNNEVQGTFLEVSNVEVEATITTKYYFTGSEAAISYNP